MSNLTYFMTDNITDPRKEGLPLFGIGYGTGNSVQSFRVFNSDFQCVNLPYTGVTTTTASIRYGMALDQYYMYSLADYTDAESQFSTGAVGVANFTQSVFQNDQYPMTMYNDCSPLGYRRGVNAFQGSYATYSLNPSGAFLIGQILPEGVRPRRFFSLSNTIMTETFSLNAMQGTEDYLDIQSYRPSGANTLNNCRGAACYNERTKTFVATFGTTSTSTEVNIWKGTVDLNSCDSLQQFFSSATVTGFVVARTNYDASYNRYNRKVLVGDNDYIAMVYNGNGGLTQYADLISPAGILSALGNLVGSTQGSSGLTSSPYYMRMQTTWDNKWAFMFGSYYYYGCGAMAFVFSTQDPTRWFSNVRTNTSGGGAFLPIGASSMGYFVGTNTDTSGVPASIMNFQDTNPFGTGATTISTSGSTSPVTISNGAAISPSTSTLFMHGGFYSTCYPRFMTINWWPVDGKFCYEGTVR